MNRLFVNALKSVGLVGAGDDPEATVTFWKSRDLLPDPDDVSKMEPSGETAESDSGDNVDLSAIEDADLRKSIEDAIAEKDTTNEELQKQVDELTAKVTELDPPDPTDDAPDEVKDIIKAQEERLAKAEEALAKERAERRTAEYIEKAKPLAVLLGKAEEVGPVMAELSEKAPEAWGKLENALTAAAQRDELAKLFSEVGAGETEGDADPIAKRDSWVADYLKDNPKETEAQARAAFWKAHPDAKEDLRS